MSPMPPRNEREQGKSNGFLNMQIVFINRHAAELFLQSILSSLKYFHKKVFKSFNLKFEILFEQTLEVKKSNTGI